MEKVTGVPGEHMTRDKTLDGVEEIIGKSDITDIVVEEPSIEKSESDESAAHEHSDTIEEKV